MQCSAWHEHRLRLLASLPELSCAFHVSDLGNLIFVRGVGTYIDKKCPFTGNVSIRGRILAGVVKSTKMTRTIIVRRNYFHYIKKYQRCAPVLPIRLLFLTS